MCRDGTGWLDVRLFNTGMAGPVSSGITADAMTEKGVKSNGAVPHIPGTNGAYQAPKKVSPDTLPIGVDLSHTVETSSFRSASPYFMSTPRCVAA